MLSKTALPIFITAIFGLSTAAHSHPQRRNGPATIATFHNNSIGGNLDRSLIDVDPQNYHRGALERRTNHDDTPRFGIIPIFEIDMLWFGRVTVGTTHQKLNVLFDMASSGTWFASAEGADPKPMNTCDPHLSRSMVPLSDRGKWYSDVVTAGGVATRVRYESATKCGSLIDGVIGMALPHQPAHDTFLMSFAKQHGELDKIYAFSFGQGKSEFYLGWAERFPGMESYPLFVDPASGVPSLENTKIFVGIDQVPPQGINKNVKSVFKFCIATSVGSFQSSACTLPITRRGTIA